MTSNRSSSYDDGTFIILPYTILLNIIAAVATAKSITNGMRTCDRYVCSRHQCRITTAKDFLDTGNPTTVDQHVCLLSISGQIVSQITTTIDTLDFIFLIFISDFSRRVSSNDYSIIV